MKGIRFLSATLLAAALFGLLLLSPRKKLDPALVVLDDTEDGKSIAGGTADGVVYIWRRKPETPPRRITFSDGTLNDLQFSPDGKQLVVANRSLTLLDLDHGDRKHLIRDDAANYGSIRFSPVADSLLTINGKGAVALWDLQILAWRPLYCCSSIWGEIAFTPDGASVLWAGHWPGLFPLQPGKAGALPTRLTQSRQIMTFGPIAFDTFGNLFLGSQDGRVHMWELATKRFLGTSPPLDGYVHSMAVQGSSGWIAYAAKGGPVHLWHPETGARRVVAAVRPTSNLLFNAAQNDTALGTASGHVEFWDLLQQRRLATLASAASTQ